MADIYDDLSLMVIDLLKPSQQGGFGQQPIVLRRSTPGVKDPAQPTKRVQPVIVQESLQAAMQITQERANGNANVAGTGRVVAVPPTTVDYSLDVGSDVTLEIIANNRAYHVTKVEVKPPVGKTVAVVFTVSV